MTKEGLQAEVLVKKSDKTFRILLGNKKILTNNNITVPDFEKSGNGATILYLAID